MRIGWGDRNAWDSADAQCMSAADRVCKSGVANRLCDVPDGRMERFVELRTWCAANHSNRDNTHEEGRISMWEFG